MNCRRGRALVNGGSERKRELNEGVKEGWNKNCKNGEVEERWIEVKDGIQKRGMS